MKTILYLRVFCLMAFIGKADLLAQTPNLVLTNGCLAPEQVAMTGQTLIIGNLIYRPATESFVTLWVTNTGDEAVGLTGAEMPTTSGESIKGRVAQPPMGLLLPGKSLPAILAFKVDVMGDYSAKVIITHDHSVMSPLTVTLSYQVAPSNIPSYGTRPKNYSPLVALGDPLFIRLDVVTRDGHEPSRVDTWHWYKNGKLLPNQRGPVLYVPVATASDAGSYHLVATWSGLKEESARVSVGVFEKQDSPLRLEMGKPLSLSARVWGPQTAVYWDPSMPESRLFRGTATSTLRVSNQSALRGFFEVVARATIYDPVLGVNEAVCVQRGIEQVLQKQPLIMDSILPSVMVKDVELDLSGNALGAYSDVDEPITYTARGLPPGLQLREEDNVIWGAPTMTGVYKVRIDAHNSQGEAKPFFWVVEVLEKAVGDFGAGGTFLGVSAVMPNRGKVRRNGRIELELTPGGGFTGQLQIGGQLRRFFGRLANDDVDGNQREITLPLKPLAGNASTTITLQQRKLSWAPQWATLNVTLTVVDDDDLETSYITTMERILTPTADDRLSLAETYNIGLNRVDDEPSFPSGAGFGRVTFTSSKRGQIVGTLADGSGFTASSALVRRGLEWTLTDPQMFVAFSDPKIGSLLGHLVVRSMSGQGGPGFIEGEFKWSRPSREKSRFAPEGLDEVLLSAEGLPYIKPAYGQLLLNSFQGKNNVVMRCNNGGLLDQMYYPGASFESYFTLTDKHRAWFANDLENLKAIKLNVYTPTGFFTGQFTHITPVTDDSVTVKVQRKAHFRGMMIGRNRGSGFFLFPSLPDASTTPPTTLQNSRIYSGRVTVTP